MQSRKIIVTSSLPYANGDLHLGHLVEATQTDIWVRFQKMRGHHCYYICGSDAHGTPIMLKAQAEGIEPAELVKEVRESQIKDFADFHIAFDSFHTTHSPENQHWTNVIYHRLEKNGDIIRKVIEQAYDPVKNMFLPDRFIKGECPRCGALDQYGDSCESCGATYSPLEMKNPISVLSGEKPVKKKSEHLFFNLAKYEDFLKTWLHEEGHVQKSVAKKLNEWFKEGLESWDISRDAPYFGFKIPGTENKYFYVWLDAPIGYIASFAKFCHDYPEVDFEEYWDKNSDAEIVHFVGKDVVYFHSLFWPALLHSAELHLPTAVFTHGFLTVNGQKMSKSRGTFINARTYLNHLNSEYFRYYIATKLTNKIEDIDLSFDDFKQKINSDLVGKLINIASRTSGFITKYFDGMLSKTIYDQKIYNEFIHAQEQVAHFYETRQYSLAMREIMRLADVANQFVSDSAPWTKVKEPSQQEAVHGVCTLALNLFHILVIYLKPVMPELAKKVSDFLNVAEFDWHDSQVPLLDHKIEPYAVLMTRIEDASIAALKQEIQSASDVQKPVEKKQETKVVEEKADEKKPLISIDDFSKIDLRIARIIHAESIPEADKLLKLQLDLGPLGIRQVFAGIKSAYTPEILLDKLIVCVANLEPRRMRFGISEGMVLCAGNGKDLWLIEPDTGAQPGDGVK